MRFTPEHGRAILRGDKTTHRIPSHKTCPQPGDLTPLHYHHALKDSDGTAQIGQDGRQQYTYSTGVQLRVLDVYAERLEDITDESAQAEGFANFGEFLDYWEDKYGPLTDRRMSSLVWVIRFKPEGQDAYHFLSQDGGYTTSTHRAVPEEPEAIDPDTIKDLPASLEARQRWHLDQARKEAQASRLSIAQRVAYEIEAAKAAGIDIRDDMRVIQRRLDAIANRRLNRAA